MGTTVITVLIIVIVIALLVIIVLSARSSHSGNSKKDNIGSNIQKKGRSAVVRDLEKRLAHDPHDINALQEIGIIYLADKNYEKVLSVYKTLYDLSTIHTEIDIAKVTCKMGVAYYYLGKFDDAIQSLIVSVKKVPDEYETNYYLGKSLVEKGVIDKAIACFRKCRLIAPEDTTVFQDLGLAYFKAQRYKDSLPYFKKVLDENPDNKENLFNMAIALEESGILDKALKIFLHLRPDPLYGAQSCLEAGKLHEKVKDIKNAIQDYEIALKLPVVSENILLQIKYRCACCYFQINNISKGLVLLKQIRTAYSGYKDVDALITRYTELNKNQNLQTYLLAGTSDFVALCRRFIQQYHSDGFVKIEDVSVQNESIEIICSVESSKWEAKELFRFYRSQTVIGDINIREFHSKMRDTKCDNGICVSMGNFSEGAHKYCEGRPVDLIEKDELCTLLKKINMFN